MSRAQREELQGTASGSKPKKLPKLGEDLSGEDSDDGSDGEIESGEGDLEFENEAKKHYNMNKKDEMAFDAFMNKSAEPRKTLADLIQEKLTEKR